MESKQEKKTISFLHQIEEFEKEFLGYLPLNEDLRTSADNGKPLIYSKPDHKISKIFIGIAEKIRQSFL